MCGINCIYDPSHKLRGKSRLIMYMNNQMIYRGPDDEGVCVDETVSLAMRRLSIIDVNGGHQPIFNENKTIVLICNGEIYNYIELMDSLKAKSHHFISGSDAEVIIHLYEEKGEACLEDLRGMFAFVLWDNKQQRLFAARDRIGIKPLYFSERFGTLWLSSELKAIVGAAQISPSLRPQVLYQFLLYGYAIDQRHTIVEEVKRVLPGEYVVADTSGIMFKRYWAPTFGSDEGVNEHCDEEILETIQTAVRQHFQSDVPVGILLSGGIDSSALAAFALRSGKNYTALCAGYIGHHEVDERPQAHATASFLGLHHMDVILDPAGYEANFNHVINFCDEPSGDVAAMPQWSLYSQAKELGYKVLISGIGGDEVFFGYPKWNEVGERCKKLSSAEFERWAGFDQDQSYINTMHLLKYISSEKFVDIQDKVNLPLFALRDQAKPGPDAINSLLFGTYLIHNGCFLADKLGMGCSVEVRVPLLDHILIQTIFDLPLSRRFKPGRSKVLLRRLLRGFLPDTVLDGEKRGFTPPNNFVDTLVTRRITQICDGILPRDGWINHKKLYTLCSQHAAIPWLRINRIRNRLGIPKSTAFLFRLLAFESWYSMLKHNNHTNIKELA